MKLLNMMLVLSLLFTAACSSSKKEAQAEGEGEEVTDVLEGDSDFIVDGEEEDLVVEDEDMMLAESGDAPTEEIEEVDEGSAEPVASAAPVIEDDGTYRVKNGDTLMMIAFKVYGDYRRWRDIARYNGISPARPQPGTVLKYQQNGSGFRWNPAGLPYLIKRGDSLVSISNDKYGTPNKWRSIYNNNRPMIRDPNLIFAGFTLYYLSNRDVASE